MRDKVVMAINPAAAYVNILYHNRIDVSGGINVNKFNNSKECMICHNWYFLDSAINIYEPVCNSCHDISMIAYEFENLKY